MLGNSHFKKIFYNSCNRVSSWTHGVELAWQRAVLLPNAPHQAIWYPGTWKAQHEQAEKLSKKNMTASCQKKAFIQNVLVVQMRQSQETVCQVTSHPEQCIWLLCSWQMISQLLYCWRPAKRLKWALWHATSSRCCLTRQSSSRREDSLSPSRVHTCVCWPCQFYSLALGTEQRLLQEPSSYALCLKKMYVVRIRMDAFYLSVTCDATHQFCAFFL